MRIPKWERVAVMTLSVLAILLVVSSKAAATEGCPEGAQCITHTFSPGNTNFLYQFSNGDSLRVEFRTVLTTFSLQVTRRETATVALGENFPEGTACVLYDSSTPGDPCTPYDFSGSAAGPHGVPQRNVDYKGLITLTLTYLSSATVRQPVFGHAPGDSDTFSEDILTNYSDFPITFEDPTMQGGSGGFSSVIALDQPLAQNGDFCGFEDDLAPSKPHIFRAGEEIEVEFRLKTDCTTGTAITNAIARLSVQKIANGEFQKIRSAENENAGNRFRFEKGERVYEFSLSTKGYGPGDFTLTVISNKFSPKHVTFTLVKGKED